MLGAVSVAHKWCPSEDVRRRVLPPPRHGKRNVCNHATKHSFNQTDNLISQGFVEYIELKDGSNRRKDYLEYLTILREQRQMSEERKIAKYIGKWLYWIHWMLLRAKKFDMIWKISWARK